MKCGQPLRTAAGLLVAGQSAGSAIAPATARPKQVVQPGGFFPRLIALIIDTVILGVIFVPIIYLWAGQQTTHSASGSQSSLVADLFRSSTGSLVSQYSNDQLTQLIALLGGLQILALFYYVGTWSILGGSPGQLLMSLRIVDREARTIGFGQALIRYVMKGLFGVLAPVSAVMVALAKDKRAIHDTLAGTYVIQFLDPTRQELPEAQPAAPEPAPAATPPAPPPPPPIEPVFAGAELTASTAGGDARQPAAVLEPPAATPPPISVPAPPAEGSVFERYAPPTQPASAPPEFAPVPAPESVPAPTPAPAAAPEPTPPPPAVEAAPEPAPQPAPPPSLELPAPAPQPAPPVAAEPPEFPTSQLGGLQPMAPRPAQPQQSQSPEPAPYEMPFAPAPQPADPPAAGPSVVEPPTLPPVPPTSED